MAQRVLNRKATAGYREIMYEVRLDEIKHDPWGTALHWMGGIADVVYVLTSEILPEYQPSIMLNSENGRDYLTREGGAGLDILSMYDNGEATIDDMRSVYMILNRLADWAEKAGRSY